MTLSFRDRLRDLYALPYMGRGVPQSEHLLKHILETANRCDKLGDLLKLLHYLDDESASTVEAIESFADSLLPILLKYINNDKRDSFLLELNKLIEGKVDEILDGKPRPIRGSPPPSQRANTNDKSKPIIGKRKDNKSGKVGNGVVPPPVRKKVDVKRIGELLFKGSVSKPITKDKLRFNI